MGTGQPGQESVVDEQIVHFIELIERSYLTDVSGSGGVKKMDLGKVCQFLTQDITSAVEFGESLGYLEANRDRDGVIAALEGMQVPCAMFALLPELLWMVTSRAAKPLMPKPTDKQGIGRLVGMIQERVGTRYGDGAKKGVDSLQQFVESKLTQKEVEAEALVVSSPPPPPPLFFSLLPFTLAGYPEFYYGVQAHIFKFYATLTTLTPYY